MHLLHACIVFIFQLQTEDGMDGVMHYVRMNTAPACIL